VVRLKLLAANNNGLFLTQSLISRSLILTQRSHLLTQKKSLQLQGTRTILLLQHAADRTAPRPSLSERNNYQPTALTSG